MNNRFIKHLSHGSMSFVKYREDTEDPSDLPDRPERCLDLGCGVSTIGEKVY